LFVYYSPEYETTSVIFIVAFKGTTFQEMDSRSHIYIRVTEIDFDVSRSHSDLWFKQSLNTINLKWIATTFIGSSLTEISSMSV